MKFNKQKIEEIKNKIRNIKDKVSSDNKERVPRKYYALLILMVMLGVVTISGNIKEYIKSRQEEFVEYELQDKQAETENVEIVNYKTAESSISTDVSSMKEEQLVETISANSEAEYIWPVVGEVIKEHATEKLVYSATLGMWKTHPGIDIKASLDEEVKSVSNGKVTAVEKDSFYGNTIKVTDENGYTFIYSNLDNNILPQKGDEVERGEIIGTIGVSATGELQDQTHLHFEVIKDGVHVNPQDLIN